MNYLNSKNLIGALFVRDTNDKPLKLVTAFKKATKTTLIIASAILTITILGTNATAAPVIDVAPPTYNIFEGDTVILDGLTTFVVNTTDNPHSATVDWGEGAGPVAATVDDALGEIYGSNIYEDEGIGSYSSQICVLNSVSASDCQPFTVNVANVAPVVTAAGATPSPIDEGSLLTLNSFTFTDVGSTDTHSVSIDWGDASSTNLGVTTSPVASQTHTYGTDGVYDIVITVTDNDVVDGVGVDTVSITVNGVAPVVTAGVAQFVNEGDTVNLDPSTYTEPGTSDVNLATINWGDGTIVGPTTFGVDQGANTVSGSHVYTTEGTYTVTITVEDEDALTDNDSFTVVAANLAPVVTSGGAQVVAEGVVLNLNDATFTDAGSADTHSVVISWGDLSPDTNLGTITSPATGQSHTYTDNGPYTVTITVTDDSGAIGTDTASITVNNANPVITTGGSEAGSEGATFNLASINFTDSGLNDTHSGKVDWGDGDFTLISLVTSGVPISGLTHTYVDNNDTAPFTYPITITITDSDAGDGIDTSRVANIANTSPTAITPASLPVFTEGIGNTVLVSDYSDPAGIYDTHTAVVDWGDGSPSVAGTINNTTDEVTGYQYYSMQGMYTISTTVTDSDGGIDFNQYAITVGNSKPLLTVPGTASIAEGSPLTISTISFQDFGGDAGSGDLHTATINWGDGTVVGPTTVGIDQNANTISVMHTYVDEVTGTFLAKVIVYDDENLDSLEKSITVTVTNANPTVTSPIDVNQDIGTPVSPADASFTDAGTADTHTATVDWGDGTGVEVATVTQGAGSGTVALGSHSYLTDNIYTVIVTVTDNDGGIGSNTFSITINNVAPVVTPIVGGQSANEGSALILNDITFSDLGTLDTHTATINWGDGSALENLGTVTSPISGETHTYDDDQDYEVIVTVIDNGGESGSDPVTVTILNVAPSVTALINTATITEGDMVSLSPSTFTDVGVLDTHTATIDWGDGTVVGPTTTIVNQGAGTVSGMHTFVDEGTGTYNVTVTVDDGDGGITAEIFVLTVLNTAPVAESGIFPIVEDSTNNYDTYMVATDAGSTDVLTYTISTSPSNGALSPIPLSGLYTTGFMFTYTPNSDYSGDDIMVYEISDDSFASSGPTTITFRVTPLNDLPVPTAANIETYVGGIGATTIYPNDPDIFNTHTYTVDTVTNPPTQGLVTTDNLTGVVTYTPTADPHSGSENFDVIVEDSSGGIATITIGVLVYNADGEAPKDGVVTAVPGNATIDLTWDEVYDQINDITVCNPAISGININSNCEFSDNLSGIDYYTVSVDTAGFPTDCSVALGIVPSIVDFNNTSSSYTVTHGSLTNGTTYYYRVCATDNAGKTSTGITFDSMKAIPVAPAGVSLPGYDTNQNGRERLDGYSDADSLVGGIPAVDTEHYFSIVVSDTNPSQSVTLYVSSRADGSAPVAYTMTCDGNFGVGSLCEFITSFGPSLNIEYYFEVVLSDGTIVREPTAAGTFITGPATYLLNTSAMVGIPRDMTSSTALTGSQTFGNLSNSSRWISGGLSQGLINNGFYQSINVGSTISSGEGFFILTEITTSINPLLYDLDNYADNVGATSSVTLVPGWNIISNPYPGNVYLKDFSVGGVIWADAVTAGSVLNGIYYYNGKDWGSTYTLQTAGGSPEARLIPWVGYWIYLKEATSVTLTVPKP